MYSSSTLLNISASLIFLLLSLINISTTLAASTDNIKLWSDTRPPFPMGGHGGSGDAAPVFTNIEKDRFFFNCKPNPADQHMCTFSMMDNIKWKSGASINIYNYKCDWIGNAHATREDLKYIKSFRTQPGGKLLDVHMDLEYPHRGSQGFTLTFDGRVIMPFVSSPFPAWNEQGVMAAQRPGEVWWGVRAAFPC